MCERCSFDRRNDVCDALHNLVQYVHDKMTNVRLFAALWRPLKGIGYEITNSAVAMRTPFSMGNFRQLKIEQKKRLIHL